MMNADSDADLLVSIISIAILVGFAIFLFIAFLENSRDSRDTLRRKEYMTKLNQVKTIVLNKDVKSKYIAFKLLRELGDLVTNYDELEELNELKWAVYSL